MRSSAHPLPFAMLLVRCCSLHVLTPAVLRDPAPCCRLPKMLTGSASAERMARRAFLHQSMAAPPILHMCQLVATMLLWMLMVGCGRGGGTTALAAVAMGPLRLTAQVSWQQAELPALQSVLQHRCRQRHALWRSTAAGTTQLR